MVLARSILSLPPPALYWTDVPKRTIVGGNDRTFDPKGVDLRPVRFVETYDGLSLAWSRSGSGAPLVKALSHLEYDLQSPIWAHWVTFFESHFDYLRYDERGCGLSDRATGELTVRSWTDDLERVVAAADFPRPLILLAMSQGTAAAVDFAVGHPEQVSHLIICGGYARGVDHRGNPEAAKFYDALTEVFRMGWELKNPAFREVFTKRFVPDGDPDKIRWFNELCQRTTTPEIGAKLLRSRGEMDVSGLLSRVKCKTLILHADGDQVVPLSEGQYLARHIPNAELMVLQSDNHILQEGEPAWRIFCDQILAFVGEKRPDAAASLTARERQVLEGLCSAKSNKEIARDLGVSDKTVRNQLTSIFAKLGVTSRQEAILKMTAK